MIRADLDIFFSTKISNQANQNTILQMRSVNSAKKIIKDLKWQLIKDKHQRMQCNYLSINYWCLAETIVNKAGISGFVNVLAMFMKQKHIKVKRIENMFNKYYNDNNLKQTSK